MPSSRPSARPRLKVRMSISESARYESPKKPLTCVHALAVREDAHPVAQL